MTLDELIVTLESLRTEHGGGVTVMHHDEWTEFMVERVWFESADDEGKPACIVIEGDSRFWDYNRREYTSTSAFK